MVRHVVEREGGEDDSGVTDEVGYLRRGGVCQCVASRSELGR